MGQRSVAEKLQFTNHDWHCADIVAALRKKGWSLRQLSLHHGYVEGTLKGALQRPWPKGEQIIADAIGVQPDAIWPSRYSNPRRRGVMR